LAGYGAIGSFFIGRGETKFIPLVLIFTNTMNLLLDLWFVFGGWGLPALGIKGAALATGVSQITGFLAFLCLFLRRKYRQKYAVHHFQWDGPLLKKCLRIGSPAAVTLFCNISGWSIAYQFLALKLPAIQFMAYAACHTVYNLVYCLMDGLGKSLGVVCSNLIGAQQPHLLGRVLGQSQRWNGLFAGLFLLILSLFSNAIISLLVTPSIRTQPEFLHQMRLFLVWLWGLFPLETAVICANNFLIALAKTRTVFLFNVSFFWGISLIPSFFLFGKCGCNPIVYLQLIALDCALRLLIFFLWFRRKTWLCPHKI
jgi:MATE family multidrug resistance protein